MITPTLTPQQFAYAERVWLVNAKLCLLLRPYSDEPFPGHPSLAEIEEQFFWFDTALST